MSEQDHDLKGISKKVLSAALAVHQIAESHVHAPHVEHGGDFFEGMGDLLLNAVTLNKKEMRRFVGFAIFSLLPEGATARKVIGSMGKSIMEDVTIEFGEGGQIRVGYQILNEKGLKKIANDAQKKESK